MGRIRGGKALAVATDFGAWSGYTVVTMCCEVMRLRIYLGLAIGLNFLVDLLLLASANRLSGYPVSRKGCLAAAALGGVYGGTCFLPGFSFLGNGFWRLVMLVLMGLLAFGWQKSAAIPTALFVLLKLALSGAALGIGDGGALAMLLSAGALGILCAIAFQGGSLQRQYVDVELRHHGKEVQLTALRDTGNCLRDPVTGQSVLIADAAAAWELLGLEKEQLRDPVKTLGSGSVRGLRLIPYRAVGCGSGLLLGIRVQHMRIGAWQGSGIVAFAPEGLGEDGRYRALTGGTV